MLTRHSLLTAAGALLGAAATAVTLNAFSAIPFNHLEYLTFNRPVQLPGVSLGAGTYSFETADAGDHVVRVRNRATNLVVFQGFTMRVDRPASMTRSVTFGESRRDEAVPIVTWYPPDMTYGHQFIYRGR